ncbi:MAG: TfoX/Sxy family protein [Erysipelotrichaceae bacterium]|nr:TfoX/Sxy family protein [Erysipelotrichaceae bacterium]
MASSREYLEYIMEQLSSIEDVSYRPMMGEFIIYCQGKIIGGVYDDRFLVKPTKAAAKLMPEAEEVVPYPGAKPLLLVDEVDNRMFLSELIAQMIDELPLPRKR